MTRQRDTGKKPGSVAMQSLRCRLNRSTHGSKILSNFKNNEALHINMNLTIITVLSTLYLLKNCWSLMGDSLDRVKAKILLRLLLMPGCYSVKLESRGSLC
ncbi:hypothetical protein CEXT_774821 [Caerostris extrusa]|uniref:Uncharacterized protein n=1 Tax=Caerostris extrusa TaxID=172846 RepID=A0AAV4VM86_CAEEX|nr:hypothetical protein CEXT_774821 [Caerostris extrusa]